MMGRETEQNKEKQTQGNKQREKNKEKQAQARKKQRPPALSQRRRT